jgi:hypothetical protein
VNDAQIYPIGSNRRERALHATFPAVFYLPYSRSMKSNLDEPEPESFHQIVPIQIFTDPRGLAQAKPENRKQFSKCLTIL